MVRLQAASLSVETGGLKKASPGQRLTGTSERTTAAGEEPTSAGRGLKGPKVGGGFLGQGLGTGGDQPASEASLAPTDSTLMS